MYSLISSSNDYPNSQCNPSGTQMASTSSASYHYRNIPTNSVLSDHGGDHRGDKKSGHNKGNSIQLEELNSHSGTKTKPHKINSTTPLSNQQILSSNSLSTTSLSANNISSVVKYRFVLLHSFLFNCFCLRF